MDREGWAQLLRCAGLLNPPAVTNVQRLHWFCHSACAINKPRQLDMKCEPGTSHNKSLAVIYLQRKQSATSAAAARIATENRSPDQAQKKPGTSQKRPWIAQKSSLDRAPFGVWNGAPHIASGRPSRAVPTPPPPTIPYRTAPCQTPHPNHTHSPPAQPPTNRTVPYLPTPPPPPQTYPRPPPNHTVPEPPS